MSGTRWCQGACVSGPGPVLELSGCLSHPVLCNRGLHVSSLQRRASLCTLSGGPHCWSGCWWDSTGKNLPPRSLLNSSVFNLRVAMNI